MLFLQKNLLLVLFLGFSSGLPLALTASTLTAFLTEKALNISTIGLFAFVALPYTLKFLWSPLVDNVKIPLFSSILGRRKGWLIFIQLFLALSIVMLGLSNPIEFPHYTAFFAFMVAFFSATQDIVIDALRIEILKPEEQAAGASMVILGYRVGMLVATAGALYIASFYGWKITFISMATLVSIGIIATIICEEPPFKQKDSQNLHHWLKHSFIEPVTEFIKRVNVLPVLIFILFYKLSDAYIGGMTSPFLLKIGFSKIEIANVVKFYGFFATILGAIIGGWMAKQIGLTKALFIGCILQILSNLAFTIQTYYGHNIDVLMIVITIENLTSSIGNTALVAYISLLCNKEFTASQYAFLSAFASFGRTTISSSAGFVAEDIGWMKFFILSATLSIPSLFFIKSIRKTINN